MRTLPANLVRVAATLSFLVLAACGYRFESEPGSRFADPGLRLDLRPFANSSIIPDAGAFLAARLREELRRTGFRGSFGQESADYKIEGKIRGLQEDVISHGSEGFALEHRVTLVVDIRVLDNVRGHLPWKEEGLSESTSYFAGTDFQYTESNRRAAVEEVCRRMARRIGQTLRAVL